MTASASIRRWRGLALANVLAFLKRLSQRFRGKFGAALPSEVVFVPHPVPKGKELADFAFRTTWYLGRWTTIDVAPPQVARPLYMDPLIEVLDKWEPPHGRPVHRLIWKTTPLTYLRSLVQPRTSTLVDHRFAKDCDSDGYLDVLARLSGKRFESSQDVISSLRAEDDTRTSLVLGTGPSANEVTGSASDWDYRILCNSAVRNQELLGRLRPTHICFGDPVFHFGPSAYAGQFRRDLEAAASEFDCILVVPEYCVSVIAQNMPSLRSRLLALPLSASEWHVPTEHDQSVRATGNVLTQQMLPLAFALATSIDIAGADGRKPTEKYFWAHSKTDQYSDDLMKTAFLTNPAFFRDTDYGDYYAQHCDAMEGLISFGERRGKTIRSVATSYIPALVSRSNLDA